MCRATRFAARFLVLIAIVAALPLMVAPSGGSSSPYVSALSELASPVYAANTCNKACSQRPSGLRFTCVDTTVNSSCKTVQGGTDCAVGTC